MATTQRKRVLRKTVNVYLDTNLVFTKDWCWFITKSLKDLVEKHKDHQSIKVNWKLTMPSFNERLWQQYQTASKFADGTEQLSQVLKLLPNAIDRDELWEALRKKGLSESTESSIELIEVGFSEINWEKLLELSHRKMPPFSADGEKGFRDGVIASTILIDIKTSPKNALPIICSNDQRFLEYVLNEGANPQIARTLDELDELLTSHSSHESKEHLEQAKKLARTLFYQNIDEKPDMNSYYVQWNVRSHIQEQFTNWLIRINSTEANRLKFGMIWIQPPTLTEQTGATYTWKSQAYFQYEPNPKETNEGDNPFTKPSEERKYKITFSILWSFTFGKDRVVKSPRMLKVSLLENEYELALANADKIASLKEALKMSKLIKDIQFKRDE